MSADSPTYYSVPNEGPCKVCGRVADRRYGSCFDCADGVKAGNGFAWHILDPETKWRVNSSGMLLEELQ